MCKNKLNVNDAEKSKQLTDEETEKSIVVKKKTYRDFNKKKLVIYSNDWFEYKLLWYKSSDLPHTREYIINKLKEDPDFLETKGFMVKEDFIEQYKKSRIENNLKIYNYDFSLVPETIPNRTTKVKIIVNEIDIETGKPFGIWETDFKHLVKRKQDMSKLSSRENAKKHSLGTEEFVRRAKEKFGEDTYGYDRVNYISSYKKVEIFCKKCGNYFWQTPQEHLNSPGLGCPTCVSKYLNRTLITTEEFCNRLDAIFGNGYFDYSETVYVNSTTPVTVIDPKTGVRYTRLPQTFYEGSDPHVKRSKGEYYISFWLEEHPNIKFRQEVHFKNSIIEGKSRISYGSSGVFIDFIVYLENNREIWIEYNGSQHYTYSSKFFYNTYDKYLDQIRRDNNVREYCKLHSDYITYLEIPYTVDNKENIFKILDEVILNSKDPKDLIVLPKIKFKEGGSKDGQ